MLSNKRLIIVIITVLILTVFSGCSKGAVNRDIEIAEPDIPLAAGNFEEADLNEYAAEVVKLINIERQSAGLSDLEATDDLTNTAFTRANELLTLFSHDRPDGTQCFTAFKDNGVSYSSAAENIAAGQKNPDEVVTNWMNSAGHKANILNADFGHVGAGAAVDSSGKLYWSLNFTD